MSESIPIQEPLSKQFECARQEFQSAVLDNAVLRTIALPHCEELPADLSMQPYFRTHDYGILVTSSETSQGLRTGMVIEQLNHRFVPVLRVESKKQPGNRLHYHPLFLEIGSGLGFSTEEIENSVMLFDKAAFRIKRELPPGAVQLNRNLFIWQLATREFFS